MILWAIAASLLVLATIGMADMAYGVAKRHGISYALGELFAALIMAMLTGIAFWVVLQ